MRQIPMMTKVSLALGCLVASAGCFTGTGGDGGSQAGASAGAAGQMGGSGASGGGGGGGGATGGGGGMAGGGATGGAGGDGCNGVIPALCRMCGDGSCGDAVCRNGAYEFVCPEDGTGGTGMGGGAGIAGAGGVAGVGGVGGVGGTGGVGGDCFVGGCSGQLCTDQPDVASTCEWTEAYACYKDATCERQGDGQCGWTRTPILEECLKKAGAI